MFTSHKQISPPSLVLKLKISEVSQKWIPKAVELKRIPTHKKCKCKKFCSQTRLVGEIYSSDVIMHRGYCPFLKIRLNHKTRTLSRLFSQPRYKTHLLALLCHFTDQNDKIPYPFIYIYSLLPFIYVKPGNGKVCHRDYPPWDLGLLRLGEKWTLNLFTKYIIWYSNFRIFVWLWSENARTKQKQQTSENRAIWFVCRTDTNTRGFWLVKQTLGWKNFMPEELSRNQSILRFDVIPQHDWPIEQCLLHTEIFFGRKTRSLCLIFHPLGDKTNNELLPKPFFEVIRKSLYSSMGCCSSRLKRIRKLLR